jgi:hypothetical protein
VYVLIDDDFDRLVLRKLRPWHVLRTRLQAATLDRELARGDAPESCEYLAVRAQQLSSPRYRRALAASLQRLVSGGNTAASMHYLIGRKRVAAAAGELSDLAERLREPGLVSARGVAMACELLREGNGPLYQDCGPAALRHAALQAIQALS